MIGAIVLAAGESTRMGEPKALLPDGEGRLFVTRLLHVLNAAGFASVTVVTGRLHDRLVAAVAAGVPPSLAVSFARNADPARGQLSSLIAGLDAVDRPGVAAALVALVDSPFVAPSTVRAVIEAWERTRAPIVRPACGARHGHPVLFDRALFADLRRADLAEGAKAVVRAHAARIVDVETGDEGALTDIDTREQYERVVRR